MFCSRCDISHDVFGGDGVVGSVRVREGPKTLLSNIFSDLESRRALPATHFGEKSVYFCKTALFSTEHVVAGIPGIVVRFEFHLRAEEARREGCTVDGPCMQAPSPNEHHDLCIVRSALCSGAVAQRVRCKFYHPVAGVVVGAGGSGQHPSSSRLAPQRRSRRKARSQGASAGSFTITRTTCGVWCV